jgi:hypothetical protein
VLSVALLAVSSRVLAFVNPADYGKYPDSNVESWGGGAGRYFTGSPADGYSCEVCHSSPSNYSFPLVQKGLPLDGYVPREPYRIELSSPAATAAYTTALSQGLNPATTLVAEFVAQDGGPAGTISFASWAERDPNKFPGLYCSTLAMTAPDQNPDEQYGMNIYVQDTASLATEVALVPTSLTAQRFDGSCTVERGRDEEGNEYERRCLMAMKACGAQSVKFVWTAPDEWRGPIWFSAGFVTTYDRSAAPNDDDFVSLMSVPLKPGYQGEEFENVLESGCNVAHGPRGGTSTHAARAALLGMLLILGLVISRSHKRRPGWAVLTGLLLLLSCIGCREGNGLITDVPGPVGAYESGRCSRQCDEPIECRKSAWEDAGTPEGAAAALDMMRSSSTAMSGANAAAGTGAGAPGIKALGTVTAQFVTAQPAGLISDWIRVAVKEGSCPDETMCTPHYVAVWIEDIDHMYVRSILGSQGKHVPLSLVRFTRLGYDCQVPKEDVFIDAMASASLYVHQPHTVTWDGLLGSGHKAAEAGMYRLRIEVAIDETHHFPVADHVFAFGDPAPSTMMFPPEPAHTGVTLTYTPTP